LSADDGEPLSRAEVELQEASFRHYRRLLDAGVAREQARKDLPLSTYTEAYWKIDLHNLLHFLKLRMDAHAQFEIRRYAEVIGEEIVRRWCPVAWEAFSDFELNSTRLSALEMKIASAISHAPLEALEIARSQGWLQTDDRGNLKRSRERVDFEEKLRSLGIAPPWG
jgi:thymidylate synthase (FAD)